VPYYYVIDRMYDVVGLVDYCGSIIERYCYDGYGRPLIRESAGRGDSDNDTDLDMTDQNAVLAGGFDPRMDVAEDGYRNVTDFTQLNAKRQNWYPATSPTVAQAFSDVDNPYMFQGVPHFALDTPADATQAVLPLNHHRARFSDPVTGRWATRDPLFYNPAVPWFFGEFYTTLTRGFTIGEPPPPLRQAHRGRGSFQLFMYEGGNPIAKLDATGLCFCCFDPRHRHDGTCITLAWPQGTCTGTVNVDGVDIDINTNLEDMTVDDAIMTPCWRCSKKCFPLPIPVIFPVQQDIYYCGTIQIPFMDPIDYCATLNCTVTGGIINVWTCCRWAS
jgi:hypothetical protein